MTQPTITLTVGDSGIRAKLAGLAALSATGFADAKENIGQYMTQRVIERFQTQKLWDGSPMPQSAAASGRTTHWKRDNKKLGRAKGAVRATGLTLVDKGHLRDSYGYKALAGGVLLYGGHGGAKKYAAIHHFGGMTGRKLKTKIIPRPVLGINADDEAKIGKYFLASIERAGNV